MPLPSHVPSGPSIAHLESAPQADSTPSGKTGAHTRSGKELYFATQPFAEEIRGVSWWHFFSTFTVLFALLAAAAFAPWWPLQVIASVLAGLVTVRTFIIYHDVMHGTILRKSPLVIGVMYVFGMLVLSAPGAWRRSHNFHHAKVGKLPATGIGSFPTMTVDAWRKSSPLERFLYLASRHPLAILGAYFTVFLYSNTLKPFIQRPLQNWDSAMAISLHGGVIAALWVLGGFLTALLVFIVPFALSAMIGAYLFYAQHNYGNMRVPAPTEWDFDEAALEASSYMKLNPLMTWFTGCIGYHHVHHLNKAIPFYRLKETMRAIPELQRPADTTLLPWDVYRCLRLKFWDENARRMIGLRELSRA